MRGEKQPFAIRLWRKIGEIGGNGDVRKARLPQPI